MARSPLTNNSFRFRWLARLLLAGLLPGCLLASGCGSRPRLVPASGVVRIDGKPAAKLVVTFAPEAEGTGTFRSVGMTNEQGEFQLSTVDGKPGVIPGTHKVTIEDLSINDAPRSADGTVLKMPAPRFSAFHGSAQQSPLKREVKNQLEPQRFELDLPKP